MRTIITISRQYGSGGKLIGTLVGQALGVPVYDKEIIDHAAENSGFASAFITENEQKMKGMSSFSVAPPLWGSGLWSNLDNFEARIFAAESEAIVNLAKDGPCVMIGRCADYVLADKFKCLNVFVHASMNDRVNRILQYYKTASDERKAQRLIVNTDKLRARHYKYYTDSEWGDPANYHICLNSSTYGVDNCVELLKQAYLIFDAQE